MLCQHIHWKVCTLTILHFIKLVCILPPPPPKKIFVFNSSAFRLFCLYKYQANTHQRRRRKKEGKKRGGARERERERGRERENMSQSNSNGLQIFWLVKSYSLIVITVHVQHFFPPKTCACSLQGIVCQTFIEKNCDSYCVVWRGMLVRNM